MKSMKKLHLFAILAIGLSMAVFGPAFAMDIPLGQALLHQISSPETLGLTSMGGMAFAGMGNTELLEIKSIIEKQGQAWEEHKKTNDELLKAKAEGKAVADLEAKLVKIAEDLDKYADLKQQFEDIMAKMQRPGGLDDKKSEALVVEVKNFNLMMRADSQSKGRATPAEFDVKQYTEYKSAFMKLVAGVPLHNMSTDEQKALSAGSDPDGGYLLPNSTVGRMIAKIYEQSTMRQLATVQTITTDKLEGIIDNDESDAGWVSEMGSRDGNDGTPQVGKYEIQAHEMYAQPKVTQKLLDDAGTDVEGWLATKTADKFARVEGTAFTTGDGIGKPKGLFSYDTVATDDDSRAWGKFQHIVTGASGAFHTTKADPLQTILGAMKDQYLQRAQWLMRREVRTLIRKLKEATSDRYLWEPSLQAGQPDKLLGYTARVDQYVPAVAADSLSLAFGDIAEAYTIVDRMGVRTLRDPFTAKPYIKLYSTKRTGGGAVNFEAVKFLKFSA